MESEGWVEIQDVLRVNLRKAREELGYRQEEVASYAQAFGLGWKPATVAAIETGKRAVSVGEFLSLPLFLKKPLWYFLQADEPILITDRATVDFALLKMLLTTENPFDGSVGLLATLLRGGQLIDYAELEEIQEAMQHLGFHLEDPSRLSRLWRSIYGEAERKAARRWKHDNAVWVTVLAHKLWGRSLSEERDARTKERLQEGQNVSAIRGHVTRELLRELDEAWDAI
ncbi:MAG: helix-turn-helix domain-containing protein [Chloroflexi bacterium]|nr:helix-turn-helix domain-containing protein [Chloroflexota bacterium]